MREDDQAPNTIDANVAGEWLNPTEASRYLGIDRKVLYRLMREGRLPYSITKWSGRRRIRREDLDQLLQGPPPKNVGGAAPSPTLVTTNAGSPPTRCRFCGDIRLRQIPAGWWCDGCNTFQ